MATFFTYAGVSTLPVTMAGGLVTCQAHLGIDSGTTGESWWLIRNATPGLGPFDEPRVTLGLPSLYDGLYVLGDFATFPYTETDYASLSPTATTGLGPIVITWTADGTGFCPDYTPSAPVLTVTPQHNPTPGLTDMLLTWTAAVSQDSVFRFIEYTPSRNSSDLTSMYETYSYLDVGVTVGSSVVYQVRGREPIVNLSANSNQVTFDSVPDISGTGGQVAAWGILAKHA